MTSRNLLLALHIASVAGWLGANFVQMVLSPRYARLGKDEAAGWTRQTIWLGERYYSVVGALVAISGVSLVLDGDWKWRGFVWVGIAVVVLGGVMGVGAFKPLAQKRLAALESGDTAKAAGIQRTIMTVAFVDTALILVAALAMIDKWKA